MQRRDDLPCERKRTQGNRELSMAFTNKRKFPHTTLRKTCTTDNHQTYACVRYREKGKRGKGGEGGKSRRETYEEKRSKYYRGNVC